MGLFSRKKQNTHIEFPPHTHTLDQNGIRIVLEYLETKPNGVDFILEGDFAMYAQLLPKYRQIPYNILLQANTKSKEKLKKCCMELGQILLDNGYEIQMRNQVQYLQIEIHGEQEKKMVPAVIMHDKTVRMDQ